MAQYQSHISFSLVLGVAYALTGLLIFGVLPEHAILALALFVIMGMLPDVDGGGGQSAQELGALLAVIAPIVLVETFPQLKAGGVARIALVVIVSYLITRIVVVRALQQMTTHRGMFHSIPAAIIIFQLSYLLFWDLFWKDKIFLAGAAFLGFLSHLLLDATSNVDLVGRALGKSEKKPPVLKLASSSMAITFIYYVSVLVLGWIILRDFYPQMKVYAGVKY